MPTVCFEIVENHNWRQETVNVDSNVTVLKAANFAGITGLANYKLIGLAGGCEWQDLVEDEAVYHLLLEGNINISERTVTKPAKLPTTWTSLGKARASRLIMTNRPISNNFEKSALNFSIIPKDLINPRPCKIPSKPAGPSAGFFNYETCSVISPSQPIRSLHYDEGTTNEPENVSQNENMLEALDLSLLDSVGSNLEMSSDQHNEHEDMNENADNLPIGEQAPEVPSGSQSEVCEQNTHTEGSESDERSSFIAQGDGQLGPPLVNETENRLLNRVKALAAIRSQVESVSYGVSQSSENLHNEVRLLVLFLAFLFICVVVRSFFGNR